MLNFDLPQLLMLRFKLGDLVYRYKPTPGTVAQQISGVLAERVGKVVGDVFEYCKRVGFENGRHKAQVISLRLSYRQHLPDLAWLAIELENLNGELARDVFKNLFVCVKGDLRNYVNQDSAFGQAIIDGFPSASNDLYDAGNCLAVGCNTAAAFHLMRVAEVGLWELGRDRQIPLAQSGKIEFSEWGKIIGELEDAVIAIQHWPNSPTKEDAHKFYNSAVVEIRTFNDGWRRHSAHARPHMPKMENDEALALWGHVFRFMNKLATKIGEGKYTPIVWT
jgi:hypothetical protein